MGSPQCLSYVELLKAFCGSKLWSCRRIDALDALSLVVFRLTTLEMNVNMKWQDNTPDFKDLFGILSHRGQMNMMNYHPKNSYTLLQYFASKIGLPSHPSSSGVWPETTMKTPLDLNIDFQLDRQMKVSETAQSPPTSVDWHRTWAVCLANWIMSVPWPFLILVLWHCLLFILLTEMWQKSYWKRLLRHLNCSE